MRAGALAAAAAMGLLGLLGRAGGARPLVRGPVDPKLASLQQAAVDAYNVGDFGTLQQVFAREAVLVAGGAGDFVRGAGIEDFLEAAAAAGASDLALAPTAVTLGPSGSVLELGVATTSEDPSGTPYFVEWRPVSNPLGWEIAVLLTSAGAASEETRRAVSARSSARSTLEDIAKKEANLAEAFNNGKFEAMAMLYAPLSHVVPPSADRFVGQPLLPDYFRSLADGGVKDLKLEPRLVAEAGGGEAVHELGVATHSFCPDGCDYYVRWHRAGPGSFAYQLVTDIQAIH